MSTTDRTGDAGIPDPAHTRAVLALKTSIEDHLEALTERLEDFYRGDQPDLALEDARDHLHRLLHCVDALRLHRLRQRVDALEAFAPPQLEPRSWPRRARR